MSWGVLAVAVLTFLTALLGYLSTRKTRKTLGAVEIKVDGNLSKVTELWLTEQARSGQLRDSLKDAGVDVPPKPGDGQRLSAGYPLP